MTSKYDSGRIDSGIDEAYAESRKDFGKDGIPPQEYIIYNPRYASMNELVTAVYKNIPPQFRIERMLPGGRALVPPTCENLAHNICWPVVSNSASLYTPLKILLGTGKIVRYPARIKKSDRNYQDSYIYALYGANSLEGMKRESMKRESMKHRVYKRGDSTISKIMNILPSTVPESMVITEDVPGTSRFTYKALGIPANIKRENGTYYSSVGDTLHAYKRLGKIHSVNRIMKTTNGAMIVSVYYTGYAAQKEYSEDELRRGLYSLRYT